MLKTRTMKLLNLLLDINLIFITIKTTTGNYSTAETERIIDKKSIELMHYYIDLTPYINDNYKNTNIYETFKSYIDEQRSKGNFIFYGESSIFFNVTNKTNEIQLQAQNLKIDEEATIVICDYNVTQKPKMHVDNETVVLNFNNSLLPQYNTYCLIMKFVGSITDNARGFFKITYINNEEEKWLIAAADFLGTGARQIFPCWDESHMKTNFTISIKYHGNYTALSNTIPIEKIVYNNGTIWTRFKTTVNISPQVAIVLSDLDYCFDRNSWCRQQVKPQTKFAQKMIKRAMLLSKNIFNVPDVRHIPLILNHVIIPSFQDEGIESWGIVLHREPAVIYDENLDVVAWKFEVARVITRKIIYQYIGNLGSQSSWSYLWVNEGIASFLAMEIISEFVHFHLLDLLAVQFLHECLRLNDYYNMSLVNEDDTPSDINSLFSLIYYIRAPIFVRSLLEEIVESKFNIDIDEYLLTYQLKSIGTSNSTIDIFFNVLQELLDNDSEQYSINVTKRFSSWIRQKRYSVLEVMRKYSVDVNVKDIIKIFRNESYPKNLWIHVTYTTQNDPSTTHTGWLTPYKPVLILDRYIDREDWIIVNVKQYGYYRVNYDKDNWQKLGNYLNSMEYLKIHVLNRAQIIDDAYYFLSINELDFSLFKKLTYYLSEEIDYIAWYPMFKILEQISGFFPFPQSTEIKEHFRTILDSVLKNIGYLDFKGDEFTKCLRQEAAKWACTLNSQECTSAAVSNLIRTYAKNKNDTNPIVALADIIYNQGSKKHLKILPGWKEWTYCKGMILAYNVTWNKILSTYILNNKVLEFLACSENHAIIIEYINRLMSGYFTEVQHRIAIFHSIIARHAKNALILDHILQNFANVVPSEISTIIALTDIINHIYSEEQLYKVHNLTIVNCSYEVYIGQKIESRLLEIKKHVGYFENFLKA